jgi:hypothetical protein
MSLYVRKFHLKSDNKNVWEELMAYVPWYDTWMWIMNYAFEIDSSAMIYKYACLPSSIWGIYNKQRKQHQTPWPESTNELYRLIDHRLSAKLVPIFADRGCHVVSVTDPYGRSLGFIDRSRCFFLTSSSSVVLTRLSGPRCKPTTSQNTW